ncbi:ABC transporter ATP-binding protein [Lacticaseibacillus kribbianus]|uniref:ABC transporter ATP-binding protein n=1 Tax=Lacticaseibacillus kribbianus TaxID=2926292 RepID=UPI001CD5A7B1|nr:ABC transporter ATP-binding protein [Lacticaseibacillus kribbianus]
MNAIEVHGVKKNFGKLAVLKGIDLTVAQGEIFTLLGENGAGKSTLINILATLSKADGGEVRVLGLDPVRDGNKVRELISLNAQETTFDEEFTGSDNLRLIAQLRGIPNAAATIADVTARLDLGSFLARKVKTYSGGMKRRLDLAMSLLGKPKLIFLDEPTTGVDPKNRLALWQLIREIRDAGTTVFLTTQYLDEADALSDHIAFIKDGVIVKNGTPAEIKRRLTTTYTLQAADGQGARARQALTAGGVAFADKADALSLDEANAARGLEVLTVDGITVAHYNRDEADLESVFLAVNGME